MTEPQIAELIRFMKGLRELYTYTDSSFDNSVSIQQRNLQLLMIERDTAMKQLSPSFMEEMFAENTNTYNLRNTDGLWCHVLMVYGLWRQEQIQQFVGLKR